MRNGLKVVLREEGAIALWKGMVPSGLRELSYSTMRFGLYKPIKTQLGAGSPRDTPLWKMMAAGGLAGGIASFIANPTDLLKTRMQAEEVGRPMLTHVQEVYAASGIAGFWRGASTTVVRAVTLGAVKMASYDSTKQALEDKAGMRKGTTANTAIASVITAANTVLCTAPVDYLRTQVMVGDGSKGMFTIASEAMQAHGPTVLWRGWMPQFMRILPYGMLQFQMMEKIASLLGTSMT